MNNNYFNPNYNPTNFSSSNGNEYSQLSSNIVSPYFLPQSNQYSGYHGVNQHLAYIKNEFYPHQQGFQSYHQESRDPNYLALQPSSSSPYFPQESSQVNLQPQQNLKSSSASSSSEKSSKKARQKSPKVKSSSPRKRTNRFDGVPEEEVAKKLLPDHIDHNLDILIIGINPGLYAAHKGHHYAGPGNHFWKCLFMSGITPEQFTANDDFRMVEMGIGFTNIVPRTTRGSADLSKKEIEEGAKILLSKLQYYKPKIAVFNGKGIYEIFSKKKDFLFGKQPEAIEGTNTYVWVMPSSSARCSQLPRAVDKLPYYYALKKFRDYLNGFVIDLKEDELVFSKLKNCPKIMKTEEIP